MIIAAKQQEWYNFIRAFWLQIEYIINNIKQNIMTNYNNIKIYNIFIADPGKYLLQVSLLSYCSSEAVIFSLILSLASLSSFSLQSPFQQVLFSSRSHVLIHHLVIFSCSVLHVLFLHILLGDLEFFFSLLHILQNLFCSSNQLFSSLRYCTENGL